MACHRPLPPAVGVCSDEKICRQMALHWGIVPVKVDRSASNNWRKICEHIGEQCRLGKAGHDVLLVSGFNDDPAMNEPVNVCFLSNVFTYEVPQNIFANCSDPPKTSDALSI